MLNDKNNLRILPVIGVLCLAVGIFYIINISGIRLTGETRDITYLDEINYTDVVEESNIEDYSSNLNLVNSLNWKDLDENRGISAKENKGGNYVLVKLKLKDGEWKNASVYFKSIKSKSYELYYNGKKIYSKETGMFGIGADLDEVDSNQVISLGMPNLAVENGIGRIKELGEDNYKEVPNFLLLKIDKGTNRFIGPIGEISIAEQSVILGSIVKGSIVKVVTNSIIVAAAIILLVLSIFFKDRDKKILISLGTFIIVMGIYGITGSEEINIILFNSPILWKYLFYVSVSLAPVTFAYFFEQVFENNYKFIIEKVRHILLFGGIVNILFQLIYTVLRGGNTFIDIVKIMNAGKFVFYTFVIGGGLVFIIISLINAIKGDMEAVIFTMGQIVYIVYIASAVFGNNTVDETGLLLFMLSLILLIAIRFINMTKDIKAYSSELEGKNKELQVMWDEINESKNEISKLNKTLEQRVIERTKQLENSNNELKYTLDKLQMTQNQLVQSEKMVALGGLVAGVSHEINTPVGVGVTAASHLQEKTKEFANLYKNNLMKKSDLEKYINITDESSEVILSNLQRASELIKSFKQVAVDQSSEVKRKFKVNEYISQVLLSLRPRLKKTKIRVGVNCDESLEIDSYPGALSQIITNLIMNSLVHAFDESDEGSIILDIEKVDNNIIFNYSDNGKGMSKEIISKIFDPFFTTKRGKGGTGLGLNIVYNIITQTFNGSIECESELGMGTLFRITFPVD